MSYHLFAFFLVEADARSFKEDSLKFLLKESRKFVEKLYKDWAISLGLAEISVLLQEMCAKAYSDKKSLKEITSADDMIAHFPLPPSHHRKLMNGWERLKRLCESEMNSKYREAEVLVERMPIYSSVRLGPLNIAIKEKEDLYRKLLVSKDPEDLSYLSQNGYGTDLLIDVYNSFATFIREGIDDEITSILTFKHQKLNNRDRNSILTKEGFTQSFYELTNGMLEGMDWSNLVAAGGSVLSSLCNDFRGSDIDLFVYGLDTTQATEKIISTLKYLTSKLSYNPGILVSSHSITLLGLKERRNIQFVLRNYRSLAEVLIGFDIDCCSFGYDGKTVWAIPRSRRAVNQRRNIIDLSRRSLTYETRLYKYAVRGFCVGVPGLDLDFVDKEKLRSSIPPRGLAWLLKRSFDSYLVKEKPPIYFNREKDPPGSKPSNRWKPFRKGDYDWILPGYLTKNHLNELFEKKKKVFYMSDGTTVHLCKIQDISNGEVTLNWITENPGRQMFTGSFHPIEDTKWEGREYWDNRVPVNYRFKIITPMDLLTQRKGLRALYKTPLAIRVLMKIVGAGRDISIQILNFLSEEDLENLTLVCKIENKQNKLEEIKKGKIFQAPEFVVLERAISKQLSTVKEEERPLLNSFLKHVFGKIIPFSIDLDNRERINTTLLKYMTEDLIRVKLSVIYRSRWSGGDAVGHIEDAVERVVKRVRNFVEDEKIDIQSAILMLRKFEYIKNIPASQTKLFVTNSYDYSQDCESLLKEVIKNLIKQLIPQIIEIKEDEKVTEEDVLNGAYVANLWPVDTFPFINSAHGIRVALIDEDQFSELFQDLNEAKEWSKGVKDMIRRVIETWIDELLITSFKLTEAAKRSQISRADIEVVLEMREQTDLFSSTEIRKSQIECVGVSQDYIRNIRVETAKKLANRCLIFLNNDKVGVMEFLEEAYVTLIANAGARVCKHLKEKLLKKEHLQLGKSIILQTDLSIIEEKQDEKSEKDKLEKLEDKSEKDKLEKLEDKPKSDDKSEKDESDYDE